MAEYKRVRHTFEPVYDDHSSVLILGTFPSVKSREQNFYYGHPGNRFWRVLAKVTGQPMPETIEEKRAFLLANGIALWDVIAECDIAGSSDSSIRNVVPAFGAGAFRGTDSKDFCQRREGLGALSSLCAAKAFAASGAGPERNGGTDPKAAFYKPGKRGLEPGPACQSMESGKRLGRVTLQQS